MNSIEPVILVFQLIIMAGQLILSWRINHQSLVQNKGVFLLTETNIPHTDSKEDKARLRNMFTMRNQLTFYVSGEEAIIVRGITTEIDGHGRRSSNSIYNTYYTTDPRFNKLNLNLGLKDSDYSKDDLDVVVNLKLENINGYQYTEKVIMSFHKESQNYWGLSRFNIEFH